MLDAQIKSALVERDLLVVGLIVHGNLLAKIFKLGSTPYITISANHLALPRQAHPQVHQALLQVLHLLHLQVLRLQVVGVLHHVKEQLQHVAIAILLHVQLESHGA